MTAQHTSWYWVQSEGLCHPLRLVKTVSYDRLTGERSYAEIGAMAMDDFGTLVSVEPRPLTTLHEGATPERIT